MTAQFLLIFLLLVVWFRESLTMPPTYDQAKGIWLEGTFLAETDFDYHRLRHYEQSTGEGGAFVYFTSALPTIIAVIQKLTPTPRAALLTYHLFHLAAGAVIVHWVFRLLQPLMGAMGSTLACVAMVTTPPFGLQFELPGMELPMIAFGVSALVAATQGRYFTAAALGAGGALLKFTGTLYLLAVLPLVCMLAILSALRRDWRNAFRHGRGAVLLALVVLAMFLLFQWGGMDHLARRPIHVPID